MLPARVPFQLVTVVSAFGRMSPALVLVTATFGWVAMTLLLYGLLAFFIPEACDEKQD